MASSSGSGNRWNHDVFLSFRGLDTRNTFTGHLHHELKSKGINVFIDNELERGEVITSQLLRVIEESRISIVVLSENYASSSFCLDELTKILECRVSEGQTVIPVFYHVDPTDVEEQKGSFGKEFAKLEAQFISARSDSLFKIFLPMMRQWINNEEVTSNMKMVQKWRLALTELATLSGWHIEDRNHEATTIQSIVKMVAKQIDSISSHVTEHHVGLASRVDYILEKMSLESNDVRILGLCGMGGIGKTTLANTLYNRCVRQYKFEGSCFLLNVRENSNRYGLAKIQEDLLYQILGDRKDLTGNFMKGMELIKQRLGRKKVFVVIDDVDHIDQIEKLAGELEWFGEGSRIIITTRDLHLLKHHMGTIVYEVIGLRDDEAMKLLSWHAFKKDQPTKVYKDLTSRVVEYSRGHPLALKVLGSYLYGRSVLEWESELTKLKRYPKNDIIKVLKISYDGLDSEEKAIFLDIALIFRGRQRRDKIIKLMDGCGFCAYISVERLIEKSLVYVDEFGRLEMHDLLEEMATQIVLKEGSRFCIRKQEEIHTLFSRDKNPQNVEAILFDFDGKEEEALNLLQFTNLRILVIENGCFTKLPTLSHNIRCLEWKKCSFQSIPFGFLPSELAVLNMPDSSIMHLEKPLDENWKAKKFLNLTRLNFSCAYLMEIMVDFSAIPNLEEMDLSLCRYLKKIDVTIGNLKRLRTLNLFECNSLTSLPSFEENQRLVSINLSHCSKLENLPNLPTTITELFLSYSGIKEIPLCFRNLIDFSFNNFISLPINTFQFTQIVRLHLDDCAWLIEIPLLPHTLRVLKARHCKSLVRFSQFQFDDFEGNFTNCCKITENEKENWREMVEKVSMKRKEELPLRKYNVYLPGNEIPKWFSFSSDLVGDLGNCYEKKENEKQSWREMVEKVSMKRKEDFPSREYSNVFPKNEKLERFIRMFNSKGICTPFQVPVPAFNPNIIGIACCAAFLRGLPIKFSVNEFTITSPNDLLDCIKLESEHMWLGFFTGFEWPKFLEAEEIWCRFHSSWDWEEVELKRVGVHFIYES